MNPPSCVHGECPWLRHEPAYPLGAPSVVKRGSMQRRQSQRHVTGMRQNLRFHDRGDGSLASGARRYNGRGAALCGAILAARRATHTASGARMGETKMLAVLRYRKFCQALRAVPAKATRPFKSSSAAGASSNRIKCAPSLSISR